MCGADSSDHHTVAVCPHIPTPETIPWHFQSETMCCHHEDCNIGTLVLRWPRRQIEDGDKAPSPLTPCHTALPPCRHLGLIIKIFQAVLNVHKKWHASQPAEQCPTHRHTAEQRRGKWQKTDFSVTKLIRLLLLTTQKNESKFNEENDKVNPFS